MEARWNYVVWCILHLMCSNNIQEREMCKLFFSKQRFESGKLNIYIRNKYVANWNYFCQMKALNEIFIPRCSMVGWMVQDLLTLWSWWSWTPWTGPNCPIRCRWSWRKNLLSSTRIRTAKDKNFISGTHFPLWFAGKSSGFVAGRERGKRRILYHFKGEQPSPISCVIIK